jgi:ribosome-associated protein
MSRHDDARRRQTAVYWPPDARCGSCADPPCLAVVRGESAEETGKLHRLERLRAELLADEKVIYSIASTSPSIDLQHLRSLRRAALLEQAQGKPPRSYRAIFQLPQGTRGGRYHCRRQR